MCELREEPIQQIGKLELADGQEPDIDISEALMLVNETSAFSTNPVDEYSAPFPAPASPLSALETAPLLGSVLGSAPDSAPASSSACLSAPSSARGCELVLKPPLEPLLEPALESLSALESTNTVDPTTIERKRFSRLFSKDSNNNHGSESKDFYADTKFTPIPVSPSAFQVLSSRVGLDDCKFACKYLFVYHGNFTHSWSLLPVGDSNIDGSVVRPVGILETAGPHIANSEAHITDLLFVWDVKSVKVVHLGDSWYFDGCHIGFQIDDFYRYEWKTGPTSSAGTNGRNPPLYLWKTSIQNNVISQAARIVREPLLDNPVNDTPLWSLEIDSDRVPAHIALLSAFAIKACHSKLHSWFAPKMATTIPPAVLVNFAFQDDGFVYSPSNKFWGDWEESRVRRSEAEPGIFHGDPNKISIIRVFNLPYLQKFAITPHVLSRINTEASQRATQVKTYYSIY